MQPAMKMGSPARLAWMSLWSRHALSSQMVTPLRRLLPPLPSAVTFPGAPARVSTEGPAPAVSAVGSLAFSRASHSFRQTYLASPSSDHECEIKASTSPNFGPPGWPTRNVF